MAYTARLRPKGVPFSGSGILKGMDFTRFRYIKEQGNRLFRYLRGPLIISFRIDAPDGSISLFIKQYRKMRTRLPKLGM